MWFLFALAATLAWGGADLFYKKGSDESDRYSHLKIAVMVGLVMGVCSLAMIPFAEHPVSLSNILRYSPASAMYILSMIIGYAGLRYLVHLAEGRGRGIVAVSRVESERHAAVQLAEGDALVHVLFSSRSRRSAYLPPVYPRAARLSSDSG